MSSYCQPTVFDSHPPELYGSVGADTTQRSGGGFSQGKESLAAGGSSPGSVATSAYMALRDQEREPSNEYDYIPAEVLDSMAAVAPFQPPGATEPRKAGEEKMRENEYDDTGSLQPAGPVCAGPGGGRGERKVTKNAMYENHDFKPLLHPALTGTEKVGVAVGGVEPCGCSTKSLVLAFFLAMTVLLSVASLGLSVLMWLGVNNPPSTQTSPTQQEGTTTLPLSTPDVVECGCPDNITLLRENLEELRADMEDVNATLAETERQLRNSSKALPAALEKVEQVHSDLLNVTSLFDSVPPVFRVFNVSLLSQCQTASPASCSLSPTGPTNCTTQFVNTTTATADSFLLSLACRYLVTGTDFTALLATLETREGDAAVRCSCVRLGDPSVAVECQLVVTSCPHYWDLAGGV